MNSLTRHILEAAAALAMVGALSGSLAIAQTPPPGPNPMPPGMTPEIMKMLMTLGEKDPIGLPPGLTPQSGCVPTMGYHYAKDADSPFGPIYGYYNGKPVFTEYMPTVQQFNEGFNLDEIVPLPGYKIDHVDIWYEKNGHKGLMQPHYDIHAWYVPHAEHMLFCNNTSGKRPPFL